MRHAVAVIGARGPAGELLLERLARSGLPIGPVHALDEESEAGGRLSFGDRRIACEPVQAFDFSGIGIVFLCPGGGASPEPAARAVEAGAVVIDGAGLWGPDPEVPLVVPGVNSRSLEELGPRRSVALPAGAAAQLAEVLAPLEQAVGLARVDVVTLEAVASTAGHPGVEELAGQSARLLNGRPVEPRVFGEQIAFNLIPAAGPLEPDGSSAAERTLAAQTRRVLGDESLPINATSVTVPVFYGNAQVVHLETGAPCTPAQARALWIRAGIRADDSEGHGSWPTPVTHAARTDDLFVARVRQSAIGDKGLSFWALSDPIRRGYAHHSVQIADLLVKNYL